MAELKTRSVSIVHKFFSKVTTVVDAPRGITLEVTKQDAKSSGVKDHRACALAQACKRTFALDGAIVSVSRAYLVRGKTATRYIVPQAISREIISFDRGAGFAPGRYELERIDKAHKQGRRIKGGGKHTGTRPKAKHVTTGIRTVIHA